MRHVDEIMLEIGRVALIKRSLGRYPLGVKFKAQHGPYRCLVDRHAMKLRTRLVWVIRAGDCVFASNSQTILARNITNAIAAI